MGRKREGVAKGRIISLMDLMVISHPFWKVSIYFKT
jgi:hypothetical protein